MKLKTIPKIHFILPSFRRRRDVSPRNLELCIANRQSSRCSCWPSLSDISTRYNERMNPSINQINQSIPFHDPASLYQHSEIFQFVQKLRFVWIRKQRDQLMKPDHFHCKSEWISHSLIHSFFNFILILSNRTFFQKCTNLVLEG